MQTVVNLDPDVEEFVTRDARVRNVEFDQALNEAIRAGISPRKPEVRQPFVQRTYDLGPELVDLTKARTLSEEWEDEDTIRKMKLAEGR